MGKERLTMEKQITDIRTAFASRKKAVEDTAAKKAADEKAAAAKSIQEYQVLVHKHMQN